VDAQATGAGRPFEDSQGVAVPGLQRPVGRLGAYDLRIVLAQLLNDHDITSPSMSRHWTWIRSGCPGSSPQMLMVGSVERVRKLAIRSM
jgi:hypothetical protein